MCCRQDCLTFALRRYSKGLSLEHRIFHKQKGSIMAPSKEGIWSQFQTQLMSQRTFDIVKEVNTFDFMKGDYNRFFLLRHFMLPSWSIHTAAYSFLPLVLPMEFPLFQLCSSWWTCWGCCPSSCPRSIWSWQCPCRGTFPDCWQTMVSN